MEILVDLPASSSSGTYFILVEPEVVRIGTSSCISNRLSNIRVSTFRRVALLAWTHHSEQYVHELFREDRITLTRGFFRLSSGLLGFINECRLSIGFEEIEAILLWEYGGPLPYEGLPRVPPVRVSTNDLESRVVSEETSRNGRYYTHLRWHKNKPKASCEFCAQEHNSR